jgi:solute carrier family 8 (sodium/calcium exchanger)
LQFKFQGEKFVVEAGDLSFSVALYTITAIIAIAILMARRYIGFLGKAELGGPAVFKWITFAILIFMWLLYVLLSSLQAYGHIEPPF